jgi:sugar lactone lactonase YvrE
MRSWSLALGCWAVLAMGCSGGSGSGGEGDASPESDGGSTSEAGGDGASNVDSSTSDAGVDTSVGDATGSGDSAADTGADGTLEGGTDAANDGGGDAAIDAAAPDASSADSSLDASSPDGAEEGGSPTDAASPGDATASSDAPDAPTPVVVYAQGVTVSTLAGNGSYGDVDGQDASFANPTGIALYGTGVIVAENDTGEIRTVSASGVTQTIARSPVQVAQTSPFTIVSAPQGYYYSTDFDQSGLHVDGGGGVWSFLPNDAGSGASTLLAGGLYVPRTLVPLPGGSVFVFDTAVDTWAPVTVEVAETLDPATGMVTWLAGDRGQTGFANGDGGAALFGSDTVGGVLLPDGSGVVVADCGNSQLRLVSLGGAVSTYAGSRTAGWVDGPKATAAFSCPHALAIDAAGNIYVSDSNNNAIRRVDPSGNVTTLAGNGILGYADGAGNVAEFYGAEGLIVSADGTTLFVADGTSGNGVVPYNRIRAITLPTLDGG